MTNIYISSSSGSDSNSGLSITEPYMTIKKGEAKYRTGDKLLLKSGDTWREQLGSWRYHSPYISTYGGSNKATIISRRGIYGHDRAILHENVVIENIHFQAPLGSRENGMRWLSRTDGLTIRNCTFQGYVINIHIQGLEQHRYNDGPNGHIENLSIVDCLILDSHGSGHTHGIYLEYCKGVKIKYNLIDNNGRLNSTTGSKFSHAYYIQVNCSDLEIEHNVSCRNFADGGQPRPGGKIHNNCFIKNPMGQDIGAVRGNWQGVANGIKLDYQNNVTMYCNDITNKDSGARGTGLVLGHIKQLIFKNNIIAYPKSAKDWGHCIKVTEIDMEDYTIDASGNIYDGYDEPVHFNKDVSYRPDYGFIKQSVSDVDIEDWAKQARVKWGTGEFTSVGLRKLITDGLVVDPPTSQISFISAPTTYDTSKDSGINFAVDNALANNQDILLLCWHDDLKMMVDDFIAVYTSTGNLTIPNDHMKKIPSGKVQLQLLLRTSDDVIHQVGHWMSVLNKSEHSCDELEDKIQDLEEEIDNLQETNEELSKVIGQQQEDLDSFKDELRSVINKY